MLIKSGNFMNITSTDGEDNYGLRVKFDIMIIFSDTFILNEEDTENLKMMIIGRLRGLGMEMPFAKKKDVKKAVQEVLDALVCKYDRVYVEHALTYDGLKEVCYG